MNVTQIKVDRDHAREQWRKYLKFRHTETPTDKEIRQTYCQISKARIVINARESVLQGGFDTNGQPKLALMRADMTHCDLAIYHDGSARFSARGFRWRTGGPRPTAFNFGDGSFPKREAFHHATALLPYIPPEHRPTKPLMNFYVLWEANWQNLPPIDPMLLRRIGRTDLYMVVAAWELTDVEAAVLARRLA